MMYEKEREGCFFRTKLFNANGVGATRSSQAKERANASEASIRAELDKALAEAKAASAAASHLETERREQAAHVEALRIKEVKLGVTEAEAAKQAEDHATAVRSSLALF